MIYQIHGIVPKKDVFLPVKVANIACVLLDEQKITNILQIKSYLSLKPKVPLVLGFENFLSKAKLHSDANENDGFIEI